MDSPFLTGSGRSIKVKRVTIPSTTARTSPLLTISLLGKLDSWLLLPPKPSNKKAPSFFERMGDLLQRGCNLNQAFLLGELLFLLFF
jgi:hypothetical protein